MTKIPHLPKAVPDTEPHGVLRAVILKAQTVLISQKTASLPKVPTAVILRTVNPLPTAETAVPLTALRDLTILPPIQNSGGTQSDDSGGDSASE